MGKEILTFGKKTNVTTTRLLFFKKRCRLRKY